MSANSRNILITLAVGLVLMAISFIMGRCTSPQPEEGVETKSDTVYIHHTDTIKVDSIIYRTKRILDTVYLPADTVLYVEQVEYEDSLSKVWVSGIEPKVDSIWHFIPRDTVLINNDTTITISEKKHWKQFVGVGLGVGAGAGYNPNTGKLDVIVPEVSLNIVYGFGYTW